MMRWLKLVGIALAIGYAAYMVLAYLLQDFLLFHPGEQTRAQLDSQAESWGITPFTVKAQDGVEIYGWHRKGAGEYALIYFHGNAGSIGAVPWLADHLPGIDVFGISYRGFPGSEGSPSEAGLELDDFITNVLDGDGPVLKAFEQDQTLDFAKPFNLFYFLVDELL